MLPFSLATAIGLNLGVSGGMWAGPARGSFPQLAQFVGLDDAHALAFLQRQAPERAGQVAGLDAVVLAGKDAGDRRGEDLGQAEFLARAEQQRWPGDGQLWPALFLQGLLQFALTRL